ncbi:MAG TPA: hypothetical protein VIQ78_02310 [Terrimesophilobacter sp.]|uniref:hypothetical protein n=1 Tax=Terrimesophilobacter sp. TaxID=2906435 RepID=UPI002F925E9C
MDQSPKPDRTLLVILSIIAALVVIALAVVFLRGTPGVLDRATPEGIVQAYSTAVIHGDRAAAKEFLAKDLRDNCETVEPGLTGGMRVTLVSSTVRTDSATVRVSVVTNYGNGPFGSSESESDAAFDLVNEGGSWAIANAPWQLTLCYNTKGNQ